MRTAEAALNELWSRRIQFNSWGHINSRFHNNNLILDDAKYAPDAPLIVYSRRIKGITWHNMYYWQVYGRWRG